LRIYFSQVFIINVPESCPQNKVVISNKRPNLS
jgi:hypothetical protein